MKQYFFVGLAALALVGCKAFMGSDTPPEAPPTLTVDSAEPPAPAPNEKDAPISATDAERADLNAYCVRKRLENPVTCACEGKAFEAYATQEQWDSALAEARTGKGTAEPLDFDELSPEAQDKMMSMMEATFNCYPTSNESIITRTCTDAGEEETHCQCMATGMKEVFSPAAYLKSVSAMSRKQSLDDIFPDATEAERADYARMAEIGETCRSFGGWPGAESLGKTADQAADDMNP